MPAPPSAAAVARLGSGGPRVTVPHPRIGSRRFSAKQELSNGRPYDHDDCGAGLQHQADARRLTARRCLFLHGASGAGAWLPFMQSLAAPVRRDRARASGLRRLRYAGLARYHPRPRLFLSRLHRAARSRPRASGRRVARRLDRGRARDPRHLPALLADAGRRRRHPCAGRARRSTPSCAATSSASATSSTTRPAPTR